MENEKDFVVKNHYLVEINQARQENVKQNLKTWSWDIYIAMNGEQQVGRALAPGKGIEIPWTQLTKYDGLEEMIEICEQQMFKQS
ncbi:hypothetical protein JCM9140_3579 [Halalkalibacter wakoensis JCM 9140]|uniref:Uncharacterized protein n=1 Tax=Halalkalibacter wakoensis JCM 9140 TaxID=1236970 RepID=W4Q630_9BACI|nr:hypothetical protein [Halalkalibacter wakoensis]GAE27432.1 hypothetical protein JCM9140_3579 [Halalkalibacter wakoensis JCM 9140]